MTNWETWKSKKDKWTKILRKVNILSMTIFRRNNLKPDKMGTADANILVAIAEFAIFVSCCSDIFFSIAPSPTMG